MPITQNAAIAANLKGYEVTSVSQNSNNNNNAVTVVSDAQDIGQRTLSARGQAKVLWNERVRDNVRDIEDMLRAVSIQMSAPLDTGKSAARAKKMVGAHAQAARALRKLAVYADAIKASADADTLNTLFDDLMDTVGRLSAVMPVSIVTRDTVNPNTSAGRIDAIKDCLTGIRDVLRNAQREAVRSVEPDMLPVLERINRAVDADAAKRIAAAQDKQERDAARIAAAQVADTSPATPTPSPEPDSVIGAAMQAATDKRTEREARKAAKAAEQSAAPSAE